MTDTSKEELKRELKVLYPGITDAELQDISFDFVNFFVIANKAILEEIDDCDELRDDNDKKLNTYQ